MRLAFLSLAVLAVAGCDSRDDGTAFDLALYDEAGSLVTTGEISLDAPIAPGARVNGTYRLADSGVTFNQAGRLAADCTRRQDEGPAHLTVRFDTDIVDANLQLTGDCPDVTSGGTWAFLTFGGASASGTYTLD
ncbi:hypothetical protein [Rubrivirga sp.]|uniref:hypothetical protein n=1 Tax=Rubrivirga sp. TaxID=1885344 RepID=UPI003B51A0D5